MKVLIVGSGGREHALAWKIRKSAHVSWLGCAPGNGGTAELAEPVNLSDGDVEGIARYAHDNDVVLTVVGPEIPLSKGLTDLFKDEKHFIFGPSGAAARIESSKSFAKELMTAANIPTARYGTFTDANTAKAWIDGFGKPVVVKASGLAAGKGVIVCDNIQEAKYSVDAMIGDKTFGDAGSEIVVEERLQGPEVSLLAICDGDSYLMLSPSQDHKRIGEGDTGRNTGGMGAYSPTPMISEEMIAVAGKEVIEPVLKTMKENGTPYRGILYAGLMLTSDGPKVLEFNCRFGDPETQAVLPMLRVDLVDLMLAASMGKLGELMTHIGLKPTDWQRITRKGYAATVVLASKGYPGSYDKGHTITGIPASTDDLMVFHAGTKRDSGDLITSGGRVMAVTGVGGTLQSALDTAYAGCDQIQFSGKTLRRDIGWRALENRG